MPEEPLESRAMAIVTPLNPDWERELRDGFARQAAMSLFGATIGRLAPGEMEIVLPFRREVTQQTGTIHAGVIAAIADSACGGAAFSLMPPGSDVVSIEFKLNLLAPAIGDACAARARVVRAGKTITTCVADVFAIRGSSETLVATMLGTMMRRGA